MTVVLLRPVISWMYVGLIPYRSGLAHGIVAPTLGGVRLRVARRLDGPEDELGGGLGL